MTTRERERLEVLAHELRDEAAGAHGVAEGLRGAGLELQRATYLSASKTLEDAAGRLTSLLSEMGDGWIETATNPPSVESYPDTIDDAPVLAWDARCEEVIKKHAVYVRAFPESYPYWQPLPEGPKR